MKKPDKQGKESGKVQITLLVAVALAAAGAGVWSEVKAATEVNRVVSRSIAASGDNAWGDIYENGDGTAWVSANVDDGTTWINGGDSASTTYSLTGEIRPGQSGKGSGSGTGTAQVAGYDFFADQIVILDIAVSVARATEVYADVVQSVSAYHDSLTGETIVNRVNRIGNIAYGLQAGSLSISAGGVPLINASGIYGSVGVNTAHSVTRIK